jgi:hypothetical protein
VRAQRSNLDRDCVVAFGSSQLAFRLRYLKEPRDIAVVKAAAEAAGRQPRPSPRPEPVLINRPELPPVGAGESSIRPVVAALANAVFDATGVRLRRAPLTPDASTPALA